MKVGYNLTLLDVIIRFMVTMIFAIAGWLLNTFTLYVIGVIILVTALTGFCPIYSVFGRKNKNWER